MGKMEKLCAIGSEYAKITLEAAHAIGSEIRVTKKKKKKKLQDENAEDAQGKQMEMDIKQEPEDEVETKGRGTAFNFKAPASHSDMLEKESRLSTTQFEVQRLSSRVSSVEIDVAHMKTDLAGVRYTVGDLKVDQSGTQAAMYGFFELQGVDVTPMSKRIEDAKNKARAELEARGTTAMGERHEKRARCESGEHPIEPQREELPWRLPLDRWSKENVITFLEEELGML